MRFNMMALAAATLFAVPAFAQTVDSAANPVPKPKKEKKFCRIVELTGSRLGGETTCHTTAEWVQIDKASKGDDIANERALRAAGGTGR